MEHLPKILAGMFGDFEMEVIPRLNSPGEIKQIAF